MAELRELAKVLRSKNAGPLHITFDIMFEDEETYRQVKECGIITRKLVATLYEVDLQQVVITEYDIVNAIKITIPRNRISGSISDSDIYGCQQHIPLTRVQIPGGTE